MGHRKNKPPQGKEFSPIFLLLKMEDNNCCLPSVKGVGLPRRIAGVEGFI
jgi:hypothetical protein